MPATGLTTSQTTSSLPQPSSPRARRNTTAFTLLALGSAFAWSYYPTLVELFDTWNREPDYSHGVLVPLLCILFLWLRRDRFPGFSRPSWWGVGLVGLSVGLRYAGAKFFLSPLDGWSIVVWWMGVALCLGGRRLWRWSLAPTLFLLFMVPLPYRMEFLVSAPLQQLAAALSSFCLQCLGQPAFAEGTTLLVGDRILQVEQSCSGLRIFVGIFALACAFLIARRHEAWEAVLLLLSAVPVALLANSLRIVVTAILFQHVSEQAAGRFTHDVAGWLMIPLAAGMLAAVHVYIRRLAPIALASETKDLVRRRQASM